MKHTMTVTTLVLLLAGATLVGAGEPWTEKPYNQWTQAEVDSVLADSPWARKVWVRFEKSLEPGDTWMTVDRTFTVQWASSLTFRQALLRQRQLQGKLSQEDIERFLSSPPADYIIILRGHDLTDLAPTSLEQALFEQEARKSIYIQVQPDQQTIAPTGMQFVRQGDRLVAAILYFPRDLNGQPVIGTDSAKVTFRCLHFSTGVAAISATFDLRNMVRDAKPDL